MMEHEEWLWYRDNNDMKLKWIDLIDDNTWYAILHNNIILGVRYDSKKIYWRDLYYYAYKCILEKNKQECEKKYESERKTIRIRK